MEEECLGDILEDENIQQPRISLKIGGNFCPNINGRRFQAEWAIDMPHLHVAGSGGAEEEGDVNGELGEEDGREGDDNGEIGEDNGEIREEKEEGGGEGNDNGEIGEEEEEEDGGEGDANGEIREEKEEDGGEGEGNGEIGKEEKDDGGEGNGNGENDRGEANANANAGGHPYSPLPYNIVGRYNYNATKCIFRVPKYIRVIEKRTYTPQIVSIGPSPYTPKIVSIGPYHYGNPKLSRMECKKKLLFTSLRIDPKCQSSLTAAMTKFEVQARKCYSTKFNHIDTVTFREMMRIDAFFIIHTFLSFDRWCKKLDDPELQGEPIFQTAWRQANICEDLLMLENQIPFFILVQVYAILTNESNESSANCLKKLAMQFFKQVEFGITGGGTGDSETVADNPKHLLDLFHSSFVVAVDRSKMQINTTTSSPPPQLPTMKTNYWVRSASALSSNGVRFIGINKGNPLDIQFNHYIGYLRVPTLCINDTTVTVLKNLVAYEQASPLTNPYFTCLAIFFSNIAPTADDIQLLREAHIINHQSADDGAIVLLLQQLYKVSHNGFNNACLIKHQLLLIDSYRISGRAQLMSLMTKRGGAVHIWYHCVASMLLNLFFSVGRISVRVHK